MYVHGYRENSAKIQLSYEICWLISSSSSLLCVLTPCSRVSLQTECPGVSLMTGCFGVPLLTDWRPSSLSSGLSGVCRHSSLCGLRANIDKEKSSEDSGNASKIPEIRSPLCHPFTNTRRDPRIFIYIYIYILMLIIVPHQV